MFDTHGDHYRLLANLLFYVRTQEKIRRVLWATEAWAGKAIQGCHNERCTLAVDPPPPAAMVRRRA